MYVLSIRVTNSIKIPVFPVIMFALLDPTGLYSGGGESKPGSGLGEPNVGRVINIEARVRSNMKRKDMLFPKARYLDKEATLDVV